MFRFVHMVALTLTVALASVASSQPAAGQGQVAANFDRFMQQLQAGPLAPPGAAVIVVRGDRTLYARAFGVSDAVSRQRLTLDLPMYNGSVTKAYTGLLASVLDADGTLPLNSSLADIWPQLRLKPPLDANRITAAQLLSHSSDMKAPLIERRNTWIGRDSPQEIAAKLAVQAIPTEKKGFVYQNFGPNTWSMMAEQRIGKPWHELLRSRVLAPLGLKRTSGRLEDFGAANVSHCHVREGGAWVPQLPKPTATMTAAGGMYASADDTARFLRATMTSGASAGGKIPAAVFRRTWQPTSVQSRDVLGMHRDGYGLGWDLGTIAEHRFIARSGDYPGCAAMILTVPDLDLGVVILLNGDIAPGAYRKALIAQVIDAWSGKDDSYVARGLVRIAEVEAARSKDKKRIDARDPVFLEKPLSNTLRNALPGFYGNEDLGTFRLYGSKNGLRFTQGVFDQPLRWAGDDMLLVRQGFGVEQLKLVRDVNGWIVALLWDDQRLDRIGT